MSKWGTEEVETIEAINKNNWSGNILDVVAGDGRFLNVLLKLAESVTAIDIDENELAVLKSSCPENLCRKLNVAIVDITKKLPYSNSTYDCVFCTGTLHLFDTETIAFILSEMNRCLKSGGKIVLDFATDIERIDNEGSKIIMQGKVITLLMKQLSCLINC